MSVTSGTASGMRSTLQAKIAVGGIQCRKSYHPEDKAFHSSDMPEHVRQSRLEVKRAKKPIILGDRKPTWNGDMSTGRPLCERAAAQLRKHDRHEYKMNYRAEVLPKPADVEPADPLGLTYKSTLRTTKRVQEMPVHPGLEGKSAWNISSQLGEKEKVKQHEEERKRHIHHSKFVSKSLVGYVPPPARQEAMMEAQRELRATMASRSGSPSPVKRSPIRRSRKPKYSSGSTSKQFKKYEHSGTFGPSPFEKHPCWSCCMSTERSAPGCIVTTVNPDAYNFASFT